MTKEDDLSFPWMVPLLRMTADHLAGVETPWPWIYRLTPREMARLLMRLLTAREALDLTPAVTDWLLIRLAVMWPHMRMAEQATWEAQVMEARNRGLATRGSLTTTVAGDLLPALTGVAPTVEPITSPAVPQEPPIAK